MSTLSQVRVRYTPSLPTCLIGLKLLTPVKAAEATGSLQDGQELKSLFPHIFGQPFVTFSQEFGVKHKPLKVGVVFSGGQAAGGHNVVVGLFDALKKMDPGSQLFGFLDGPSGLVKALFEEMTETLLEPYRNQGGFDLLGSGRTKIETAEQLAATLKTVSDLALDALVIIGGDDSNTNAAVLAEYFLSKGNTTCVIGVPKTIDGDLKNEHVAISFGFDTAAKVYAELIGNIGRDALSAKKYYHFIKLMGRSASHIALECALATQPNLTLIGEEVAAKGKTLKEITDEIADLICARSEAGKDFGLILIPEGLIEFIPEIGRLLQELNQLLTKSQEPNLAELTPASKGCFESLPESIQKQLLLTRDPHGNVNVSFIETEKLLIETVTLELKKRSASGRYKGKFSSVAHFFGYEGRAALPSNFDANYCYALGYTAALFAAHHLTGYMVCISNLTARAEKWSIGGVPLTSLMRLEMRKGKMKPVIEKALVDLNGKAFTSFKTSQEQWKLGDHYRCPGPIQFFGDPSLTDTFPLSMNT